MIITGAFIYAIVNQHIGITLDKRTIVMITPLFVLVSLIKALKNYNIVSVLMRYAKGKSQNKYIQIKYFVKKALKNNILLVVFNILLFIYAIDKFYSIIMLVITSSSLILSFAVIKNQYNSSTKLIIGKTVNRIKISPLIKGTIYDYFTPDFFAIFLISIALFFVMLYEYIKNSNSYYELENKIVFYIILTIIFSIGFMGIIDSVKNINWKFQAIISNNTFFYHIKRSMFFLIGFFGVFLFLFIIIGAVDLFLLLKYLYCIFILFFISIFVAFTLSHVLMKLIVLSLIIVFIVWISTLRAVFLLLLALPFFTLFVKAKHEYKEWYLT